MKQAPSQSGRIAVVTGANIGLGYETALALAGKGCTVVLACRNAAKADAARAAILAQHPKARIECLTLDLGSLKSVRAFAAAYKKRPDRPAAAADHQNPECAHREPQQPGAQMERHPFPRSERHPAV
jgi:NAD(P)-dependent dehydrogenase (short-subunit alcohol dehydrogenase family)